MAALPLGVYAIVQDLNVPLIVQPQLFGLFSLLSWGQCMYYGGARSRLWCAIVLGSTLVVWGALEAAFVFALRVRVLPSVLYLNEGRVDGWMDGKGTLRLRALLFHIPRPGSYRRMDISLHIHVARPRARVACASSGS